SSATDRGVPGWIATAFRTARAERSFRETTSSSIACAERCGLRSTWSASRSVKNRSESRTRARRLARSARAMRAARSGGSARAPSLDMARELSRGSHRGGRERAHEIGGARHRILARADGLLDGGHERAPDDDALRQAGGPGDLLGRGDAEA